MTRLDLSVGAYEEISSADVPGLTEVLLSALPGLREHRCSVGRPGGFALRLRRGTYAPHMLEHVALELQATIGHDVGYGRARGGDRPGEYTVAFEHRHHAVGMRAAELALGLVRDLFAGRALCIEPILEELRALARTPELPPLRPVACGIIGGGDRSRTRTALLRRFGEPREVVDVAPARLLREGLPYRSSRTAIVLDAEPGDVPPRYRDPAATRRLHSVVADCVADGGYVVVPGNDLELRRVVAESGAKVATFSIGPGSSSDRDRIHAMVRGREVIVTENGRPVVVEPILDSGDAGTEVVAALAAHLLEQVPCTRHTNGDDQRP